MTGRPVLLGTAAAARRVGVPPARVRAWASRGYRTRTGTRTRLVPVGYVGRSPRYAEADVLAAERATRLNAADAGRPARRSWLTRSA